MAKKDLEEYDVLEIIDMKDEDLLKYSKKELISMIGFQAQCLHDYERELYYERELSKF